ncbi:MAG: ABC transporter substrate-binding protein [Chloroflexota bacterium]|nr:MAG: ABC transporter substrate-binding protein [Chloroflexota bacterium]
MLKKSNYWSIVSVWLCLILMAVTVACTSAPTPEPAAPAATPEAAQPTPTEAPTMESPATEQAATAEAAATEPATEEPTATELATAGDFKGTVVVGEWQEPKGLIGPIFYQAHTYAIIYAMYYAPLALNENDELVPEMLEEVPTLENGGISEDGKTYTLKFKPGFKWHDGPPVTSADFQFTWEFIMNPDTKAQTTAGWNKIESVETPDELTAIIHMREPYAPFVPTTLALPILPKHALEGVPDPGNSEFARNPIGNGPFMFKEWIPGDRLVVVANPDAPIPAKLESIIFKFVPDINTLIALLRTGDVDLGYELPENQIPEMENIENVQVSAIPGVAIERYYFNLRNPQDLTQPHPIFSDINVRKALSMGMDRFTVVDKILQGYGQVAVSELDNTPWFNEELEPVPYDPEAAQQLLDEAGWTVGADGIREKDGLRLSFKHSMTTGDPVRENMQVFFQQNMADIGAEMIIDNYPAATLYGSCADNGIFGKSAFDMMGFTNFPPGIDITAEWSDFFLTSTIKDCETNPAGTNSWGFSDPAVDEALECSITELDPDTRLGCIKEAQKLIYDQYVTLYTYDTLNIIAYSNRLQGLKPTVFGWHHYNYHEWSVAE